MNFNTDKEYRAFDIACKGKLGKELHRDDIEFITEFYNEFREIDGYLNEFREAVTEATLPFGANPNNSK